MLFRYKKIIKQYSQRKSLTVITNKFDIRFISEVQYQYSCNYYE